MAKPVDLRDLEEAVGNNSILGDPPPAVDLNSGAPMKARPLDLFTTFKNRVHSVSDRVPAWWDPRRDVFLWNLWMGSDVMSSAIFSTCARLVSNPVFIRPKDKENKAHRRAAMWSEMLLQYYWSEVAFQFAMDWQTQDNGAFMEIEGAGDPDGPIEPTKIEGTNDYIYGTGLRILDSQNCTRTGNPTWPVVYKHRERAANGGIAVRYYKFHHTRIIFSSQMPSTRAEMHNVGLSGVSRCVRNTLRLDDLMTLEDETLGVRPATQLIFSRGITAEDVEKAFEVAEIKSKNAQAKQRAAYAVMLGVVGNSEQVKAASVEFHDLKKFPEGYDPETSMNIAINIIAMALGFDSREFWPATVRGATRADADIQDRKSRAKTAGVWEKTILMELNAKWAPSVALATFDAPDLEMDALRAEVAKVRAEQRASDKEQGILPNEIIWQQMLASGELDESQYAWCIANAERIKSEAALAREAVQDANEASDNSTGAGEAGDDGADADEA
jgi:hypothetical protein